MARKKVWLNNTLYKPGSYSRLKTTQDGAGVSISTDTMLIIGEAATGKPGSSDGLQSYSAAEMGELISKYSSGGIVDCALAARVPSKTPGISGPGRYLIWKTNASIQASYTFQNGAPANLLIVKDRLWGQAGNNIYVTIAAGSTGLQKTLTIKKLNEDDEALGENDAVSQISVQYTGDASTASGAIAGVSEAAKRLTVTLAGDQTDGSANLDILLSAYTLAELVDFINAQTGYSAALLASPSGFVTSAKELDSITIANIKSSAALFYRTQYELVELINDNSEYCEASLASTPVEGRPANASNVFLAGGERGASANADFSAGLEKARGQEATAIVIAVSQDATSDIALGLTDAASAYTISGLITALDTNMRLRGSIKGRLESQGYVGFRNSSRAACYAAAASAGSELIQLCFQDVKVIDVEANDVWKQPHVMAAMVGGMRLGSEVGEPLTFKYINAIDVKHFVDLSTGIQSGDFDPIINYEAAIIAGATFVEPAAGGFRIVVDNTTYGTDDSFIWNRGSVIEAAFYVAKSTRALTESLFVGKKIAGSSENSFAASLKSAIRNHLRDLKGDDILGASEDAPEGFVEETFVVTVSNGAATVYVEFKPIQGLDFLTLDFTVGGITQTA